MGEYYHSENSQIYADFAYRTGVIIKQYEMTLPTLPVNKQFESTLYIVALQSLLTHCQELIRDMTGADREKKHFSADLTESPSVWGLHKGLIKDNTFDDPITNIFFITKIRNSLCHPTPLDKNAEFPSTGYTTIPDGSGIISTYCFIDSPDTKNNRPKYLSERKQASCLERIPGVSIKEKENNEGRKFFQAEKDGKPFVRIFRAEIPVKTIRELVMGLSTYLAQPIQVDWDGKTINNNLIAA